MLRSDVGAALGVLVFGASVGAFCSLVSGGSVLAGATTGVLVTLATGGGLIVGAAALGLRRGGAELCHRQNSSSGAPLRASLRCDVAALAYTVVWNTINDYRRSIQDEALQHVVAERSCAIGKTPAPGRRSESCSEATQACREQQEQRAAERARAQERLRSSRQRAKQPEVAVEPESESKVAPESSSG